MKTFCALALAAVASAQEYDLNLVQKSVAWSVAKI